MSLGPIVRTGLAIAVAAGLAGACSPRPYAVAPEKSVQRAFEAERGRAPVDGTRLVGICYGNALNSPEEVLAEARFNCGDGTVELRDTDIVWTPCGLLQPRRATFVCTPAPKPEAE